jgi:hypothetical protein
LKGIQQPGTLVQARTDSWAKGMRMQHPLALTPEQIGDLGDWGIGLLIGLLATLLGYGVIPIKNEGLRKNLERFRRAGPIIIVISAIFILKALLSP